MKMQISRRQNMDLQRYAAAVVVEMTPFPLLHRSALQKFNFNNHGGFIKSLFPGSDTYWPTKFAKT